MDSFIKLGVVIIVFLGVMLEPFVLQTCAVDARRRRSSSMFEDSKYVKSEDNDNFDTSRYKFAYGVEDHKTGDFKMHQEERDGDLVKGEYTVAEADGTLRTVTYTADKHNGFHAVISKSGDSRQQVLPAPTPTTTYHRSIKVPGAATPSNNYYNNREQEGGRGRYTEATPVKKFIQNLPQFAKYHAARHNKVVENYSDENAEHYQSINIDNNKEQTNYSYKLQEVESEKVKEDLPSVPRKAAPGPPKSSWKLQVQAPVFSLQIPQGFKKAEDVYAPVALPLVASPSTSNPNQSAEEEEDNEDPAHAVSVEQPEWKQYDPQGTNDRELNNYKHIFETHFGRFRKPGNAPGNDRAAYSYMNYEGETSNRYELQHNQHNNHNIQRKKGVNSGRS